MHVNHVDETSFISMVDSPTDGNLGFNPHDIVGVQSPTQSLVSKGRSHAEDQMSSSEGNEVAKDRR